MLPPVVPFLSKVVYDSILILHCGIDGESHQSRARQQSKNLKGEHLLCSVLRDMTRKVAGNIGSIAKSGGRFVAFVLLKCAASDTRPKLLSATRRDNGMDNKHKS